METLLTLWSQIKMIKRKGGLTAAALALLLALPGSGGAKRYEFDVPAAMRGVEIARLVLSKPRRTLTVYDVDGRVVKEYPATYGESEGDRAREGDRKTPEGTFPITEVQFPDTRRRAPKIRFDTTKKQLDTYVETYGERARNALAAYRKKYGRLPRSDSEIRTKFNSFASKKGHPRMWFGVHAHSYNVQERTSGCPGMRHEDLWEIGPALDALLRRGHKMDFVVKGSARTQGFYLPERPSRKTWVASQNAVLPHEQRRRRNLVRRKWV